MIELDKKKFDDSAQEVVRLAEEEAKRFNHNYVGTEHILLGLTLYEPTKRVLDLLGVGTYKVQSATEFIIGRGDRLVSEVHGLTPRAHRSLDLAVDEGRRRMKPQVGSEELLLGLVREGEGIAAGILESMGVNIDKMREFLDASDEERGKFLMDQNKRAEFQIIRQEGIERALVVLEQSRMIFEDPEISDEVKKVLLTSVDNLNRLATRNFPQNT